MSTAAAIEAPEETPLPVLREELDLFPGAATLDGAPTWVLHDPVANRFFQLGKPEFSILSCWHLGTIESVLDFLASSDSDEISQSDVEALAEFFTQHGLIQVRGGQAVSQLHVQYQKMKRRDFVWLIKNYLFIRVPLINPDTFLTKTLPYLRWMGSKAFVITTILSALVGLLMALQQWDGFLTTFPYFFSFGGAITLALSLIMLKIFHELGHAYAAKYFGCHVPSIGVAFMVLWPVLYTDANDTWRITSRKKRLVVSAAGMMAELVIAAYATLCWNFLSEGLLKSVVFMLASSTWILTLLVNLNPFMRFDGYYLFSDLIGVSNLQSRAFALGQWQLREWLFGLKAEIPEKFPAHTHHVLLIYAFGTWIYRFFLYLGIAFLVYHFVIKLLGIMLMMVELIWFLGGPVVSEILRWYKLRQDMRWNNKSIRTVIGACVLLVVLIVPIQWDITAPALLRAQQYTQLYTTVSGRLVSVEVAVGEYVTQGQILLEMKSPDLEYEIAQGANRIDLLNWQLQSQGLNRELQERALVFQEELSTEMARQQGRLEKQETLQVRSPVNGYVRELREPLLPGEWLGDGEDLAVITGEKFAVVDAWVQETELYKLNIKDIGWFYPEDTHRKPEQITIVSFDRASNTELDAPYLASIYGGTIAVREIEPGVLKPVQTVYRVQASPFEADVPDQELRGFVKIRGERESLLGKMWKTLVSVVIREGGF